MPETTTRTDPARSRPNPRALRAALTACLASCLATSVRTGELAGIILPEETLVDEKILVLNGMGVREATWLRIKAYFAGLQVTTQSSEADAILRSELPKKIVFVFTRSVGRKRIVEEWDESLEASSGEDAAALHDRVATPYTWMPDSVRKGDRMVLTYLPGKGVVVEMKGAAKGTIPGAEFARALLAIWLGAKPPDRSLESGLPGGDRGEQTSRVGRVTPHRTSSPRRAPYC